MLVWGISGIFLLKSDAQCAGSLLMHTDNHGDKLLNHEYSYRKMMMMYE
jgi:hypothetical protein